MHKTLEKIAKNKGTLSQPILHGIHITPEYLAATDRHVLILERFKTPIEGFEGEFTIDPNGIPLTGNYPNITSLIPENFDYNMTIDAGKWINIIQVYKKLSLAEISIKSGIVTISFQELNGNYGDKFEIGKSDSKDITIKFNPKYLQMINDYGKEVIGKGFGNSEFVFNVVEPLSPVTVVFDNENITGTFLVTPMRTY